MCGAPLGATDNVCGNCGTRRSEMGPAYNNSGYPQQNGYGYGGNTMNGGQGYGNYGMNGGNQGYGNYGMNNGNQGYGNYGMNNGNQGYGNYGMNQSFGNNSFTATRTSSFNARKTILTIIAVIVFLLTFLGYEMSYNSEHKETIGDISITFPQKLKQEKDSVFADSDAKDTYIYSNRSMKFGYLKYNLGAFSMKNQDTEEMYNKIMPLMDTLLEKKLDNYKKKDQLDNHLRFYFDDEGDNYFCDMMIDLKDDCYYMYVAYCYSKNENKFVSKFRKMYDSIEYIN
jgi:hypothetical protein